MMASNRFIDALVQAATVELFHAYGVALAPTGTSAPRGSDRCHSDLACLIRFSSAGFDGNLILSVAEKTVARMLRAESRPEVGNDWLKELANQLLGRIKLRLMRFQVTIQLGLPTPIIGPSLARHRILKENDLVYVFRTIEGNVVVSLSGRFDMTTLVFSASSPAPEEGDVTFF